MSGESEFDLTGRWSGIFSYPAQFPPNQFEAEIRDSGGLVTGVITQPREFFEPSGPPQQALIDGRREGDILTFVKFYDDLGRPTPHYQGRIQPGGDEIEGEWTIPGDWSGTFIMIRASKGEAASERRVSEKV
ncbi:MAG TPA: hypothetical protein VGB59_03975 [Allosphingosinicella sp.]|jgi:hypothetical protein